MKLILKYVILLQIFNINRMISLIFCLTPTSISTLILNMQIFVNEDIIIQFITYGMQLMHDYRSMKKNEKKITDWKIDYWPFIACILPQIHFIHTNMLWKPVCIVFDILLLHTFGNLKFIQNLYSRLLHFAHTHTILIDIKWHPANV